ncbi:transporter substrate-binding domain-containing protein [Peptostreptococcus faecalis]|uniref:transporter substrate-binding domain-containing protein n=1 Tax=Peptostreptococcus faecalis TaxID=2045015 RepID=UPI000C7E0D47|nr:transporter substrate-binding domain-containing protein [Peptostreptococcus faecalis]
MKSLIKKIMSIALILTVTATLAACGNSKDTSNAGESMLAKIKEKDTLVVGTAPGYPPYEFVVSKDGKSEVVGADIDLAENIAKDLGVKLEIKALDFDALIPALEAEKIDVIIAGMTPTEDRKKSVDFSDVYKDATNSVLVRSDYNKNLKTSDDLKNIKVGVQRGTIQETFMIETLKSDKVKSLVSVPDLVADLKNGNIDAVVLSTEVALINEKSYEGIKVDKKIDLKDFKDGEGSAVAIKKGENKDFIESLNKTIKDLKDSGEYDKIMEKNIDLASKNKN